MKEKGRAYYLILFLSFVVIFSYFAFVTDFISGKIFRALWSILADSLLLFFICSLFRGKWKWIGLIFPWLVSVALMANILYLRNFSDLIPASLYLNNQANDPLVVRSAWASLQLTDIVLILASAVPLLWAAVYWKKGVRNYSLQWKVEVIMASAVLFMWISPYVFLFTRNSIKNPDWGMEENLFNVFPKRPVNTMFFYHHYNFMGYLTRSLVNSKSLMVPLSPEEQELVGKSLAEKARRHDAGLTDSQEGKPKNLILIIVESLSSVVFELDVAPVAMPNLYAESSDSANVFVKSEVLTRFGRSSDGHFMYLTGLLPLYDEPLVTHYSHNNYPGLPKILGFNSLEIIGEDKSLWSHESTSHSYGFDRLISGIAIDKLNQDSIIFCRAEEEIKKLKSPFFVQIVTLSMHNPYDDKKVTSAPEIEKLQIDDNRDKEYLRRLNHTDRFIGRFLQWLRREGLYDDTAIIIAGDHETAAWNVSPLLQCESVPFIVINGPKLPVRREGITQLDLYPTVLDIFRTKVNFLGVDYRGQGLSLYDVEFPAQPVSTEDYQISESIIRSPLP